MSHLHQHRANYRKRLTALTVAGWLAGLMALLIGLNACVPALAVVPPTATSVPAIGLTPVAISTPAVSTGTQVRLGFNIRGWT